MERKKKQRNEKQRISFEHMKACTHINIPEIIYENIKCTHFIKCELLLY